MKVSFSAFFWVLWAFFCTMGSPDALAQKDFQDGFVITTKSDTLVGRLSNIHKNSHNYIDFIYPDGHDTVFTPNHISSYETGNQRYVVVPVPHAIKDDTTYLFAKILVEGYANLYKTRIKTDPFTAAEDAYLCKKYDEKEYHPAGKIMYLADFFNDHIVLSKELRSHPHLYKNNSETKVQLFNHYNMWKKYNLDSIAAAKGGTTLSAINKHRIEVFMVDTLNLSPESKFELDKMAGKLDADPSLDLVCEFVQLSPTARQTERVMKAVMQHLHQFEARIDEKITKVSESQQVFQSKEGSQVIFYYFR